MGKFKRGITAFLICFAVMFLSCTYTAGAAANNENKTVRVGLIRYPLYAEQDSNGIWTGYDVEYTENIAQHAGFRVEFVPMKTLNDIEKAMRDGTVDMCGNIAYSRERQEKYLFSEHEQGNSRCSIIVRRDESDIEYGNIVQLSKLKYAVLDGTTLKQFNEWCRVHDISPEIKVCATYDAVFKALDNGDADAALPGDDYTPGYYTVYSFDSTPYYYIFNTDNTALKSSVDTSMAEILNHDPLYEQTLRDKYGINPEEFTVFSREENEYIRSHPVIKVAMINNDRPYFKSANDPVGFLPDMYDQIAKNTGLKFEYEVFASQENAISAVTSGKADVLGIYSNGIPYAYSIGLRLTDPYTNTNLAMLTYAGENTDDIRKISVKKRSYDSVRKAVGVYYHDTEFVKYDTSDGCFNALRKHKVDATVIALPSATYLVNQTNSSAYSFIPLSGTRLAVCGATTNDNEILLSILNKGISMSAALVDGMLARNTAAENSVRSTLAKLPAIGILVLVCILFLIVLVMVWAIYSLLKSRKAILAAAETRSEAEQQRIRAEESDRSANEKNEFFSNISHDMRTPLNAVLGFAREAQNPKLSAKKRKEYLEKVETSGRLLLDLINDTLTISKSNSGKLTLDIEAVPSRQLFASIIPPIQEAAAKKNIVFTADYSKTIDRTILADRLKVQKIMLNLLSNAVKYTPEGGHVDLQIFNTTSSDGTPDSVFVIKDDGIGMSEDFENHMYEPFSQEKRHGYESVGTGLGLTIVKHLVDLMNGKIEIQSHKDRGTTVAVRLHFEETMPPDMNDPDELSGKKEALRGKKVLIIEDNEMNRQIAAAILNDAGIISDEAADGEEGARIFAASSESEYDAVLMDLRMPVMDGYEATHTIRSMSRMDAACVPIIAMTADAFPEDIKKCLANGMNDHVAKPIEPEKLYGVLCRLCLKTNT